LADEGQVGARASGADRWGESEEFGLVVVSALRTALDHVHWLVVTRRRWGLRPLEMVLGVAHDLAIMARGLLARGEA
jgi:hypothetical protein